jgi:excisionase family DNA binding protein
MNDPQTTTVFLTADELCQVLSISRRTVSYWVSKGILPPPLRLGPNGRTLRWHMEQVVEFLQKNHQPNRAVG